MHGNNKVKSRCQDRPADPPFFQNSISLGRGTGEGARGLKGFFFSSGVESGPDTGVLGPGQPEPHLYWIGLGPSI